MSLDCSTDFIRTRVLCLVPPTGKYVREDRCQTPIGKLKTISLRPPIDLMYAAGSFDAVNCQVKFVDYAAEDLAWSDVDKDIREFEPRIILISATTLSVEADLYVVALAKSINQKICVGAIGAYFNKLDLVTLTKAKDLDFVLRGEYEHACSELGKELPMSEILGLTWRDENGEIHRNPERPFENELDLLPWPARHLTNNSLYTRPDTGEIQTTIVTNRGCPYHCIYCLANQVAGSKNRYRSVASVIEEVRYNVTTLGITSFLFRSELFTQNERWVIDLCDAIKESNLKISWACNSRVDSVSAPMLKAMKDSGCWIIAYGVESGDQKTLDLVQKKAKVADSFQAVRLTREAGIRSSVYLMIGLPWDTEALIEQQAEFAIKLDPDFLEVFYPYPFPGTPLHTLAVQEGLLKENELPKVAYAEPAIPGLYLSIEQLRDLRKRVLRKYYLRPRVVARTLSNVGSTKEFFRYLRAGAGQFSSLFTD